MFRRLLVPLLPLMVVATVLLLSKEPPAEHHHADMSPTDVLLLAVDAVLTVAVIGLLLRRPRIRAKADGRWRLPAEGEEPRCRE
jgi:hypothetical protein